MNTVKTEGFMVNAASRQNRPDFRRPFSDGSMTVATSDLASSLGDPQPSFISPFNYDQPVFPHPFHFSNPAPPSLPISQTNNSNPPRFLDTSMKPPKSRPNRKLSMNDDVKPNIHKAMRMPPRAMSFSHPDGRIGLGLQTHVEGERTDSVSPPDYAFGMSIPGNRIVWDGSGSLPSMQSFGTTIDEAILDSPFSPPGHLPQLHPDHEEESKKQRRRECHNQVEKRRREHINAKIEELNHLLPAQYHQLEDSVEDDIEDEENDSPKRKKRRNSMAAKNKDTSHCKGRILTQSVQYIHDLQRTNDHQASRIQQLESLLGSTSGAAGGGSGSGGLSHLLPQNMFAEYQDLQPMQPSPEPDSFTQTGWPTFNPVFESPPDQHNRASSTESSGGDRPPLEKLQVSMSGMDLDAVFAGRKDDDHMIRW